MDQARLQALYSEAMGILDRVDGLLEAAYRAHLVAAGQPSGIFG